MLWRSFATNSRVCEDVEGFEQGSQVSIAEGYHDWNIVLGNDYRFLSEFAG